MSNNFDNFGDLPEELQREAIREGEERLQAQLQIAGSADQRALTWGGLLIAAVTAALGGGIALSTKAQPDYPLAFLALAFAAFMTWGAWSALSTTLPEKFHVPGNLPSNWLPDPARRVVRKEVQLQRSRREQAKCIDDAVRANARRAERRALQLQQTFRIAKWTAAGAGVALLLILTVRAAEWPPQAFEVLALSGGD